MARLNKQTTLRKISTQYWFSLMTSYPLALHLPPTAAATSASTHHHVPPARDKVLLPKITLQPFDRDLTTWTTFWDSFKAAIDKNNSLTNTDKFNYIRGLLQHTALKAISGLTLTSANYWEALAILQKRFGNKPLIQAKHTDALMHVEAVTSHHNVKGLCHLYDSVEFNIRSLTALGVDFKSYGTLLASVLISKVPQELQLIVTGRISTDDWDLKALMDVLEEEIRARESHSSACYQPTVRKPMKDTPTAVSLLTGGNLKVICSYCQGEHTSNSCSVVSQPHARKQALQTAGRCFVCLRRGYVGRECRSHTQCTKCNGRHHISICSQQHPRAAIKLKTQLKLQHRHLVHTLL